MRRVRLEISATPAHVRTARLVAVATARQAGVAEDLLDEVRLAVGEACARAVGLHRMHGRPELVRIEFTGGPRFAVTVHDAAPPDGVALVGGGGPLVLPGPASATMDGAGHHDTAMPGDPAGLPGSAVLPDPAVLADPAGLPGSAVLPDEVFAEEVLADGVGPALLAGLVDDLRLGPAEDGRGTVVRMSWPVG